MGGGYQRERGIKKKAFFFWFSLQTLRAFPSLCDFFLKL